MIVDSLAPKHDSAPLTFPSFLWIPDSGRDPRDHSPPWMRALDRPVWSKERGRKHACKLARLHARWAGGAVIQPGGAGRGDLSNGRGIWRIAWLRAALVVAPMRSLSASTGQHGQHQDRNAYVCAPPGHLNACGWLMLCGTLAHKKGPPTIEEKLQASTCPIAVAMQVKQEELACANRVHTTIDACKMRHAGAHGEAHWER